jgi:biopolymer transport protein ExbD
MEKDNKKFLELEQYINDLGSNPTELIAILHRAQHIFGYLPREVQVKVTENSSNEQTSDVVSVIHLKSDKIVIDGKEVTLSELKEHISDFLAGATTVQISADFNVKMGDVADLREVLRQNNVTKVNYLQLKPEKPDTVIKVKNTSPKFVIEQAQGVDKENQPAVVIDGRKVAYKRLEKIKPEDIDHIDVVKSHGKNGTIYITTKNAKKDKEKVGVVIGGMEVPEYQLEMLDPSQISSMSVVQSAGGGTTIYVNTNDGQ